MNKKKTFMVSALASGAMLIGAVVTAGSVFAQTATTTITTNPVMDRVAQIVGIDKTKLESALKQAREEQLAQDVKDGKITQAQADDMKKHIENGDMKGFGGGMRGIRLEGGPGKLFTTIANFLGMKEEDVHTALRSGTKLTDLVTKQGKSLDALKSTLNTAIETNLKKELTDGKITQTQYDTMIKREQNMLENLVNGTMPERPTMIRNGDVVKQAQ